jgi:rod shape determining protein RodA
MPILGSQNAEDFSTTDESRFDWKLVLAILAIVTIGIVNVYSATANIPSADGSIHSYDMALRQFMNLGIGLAVISVVMIFDYRLIERLAYVIYGLNLAALLSVEFVGVMRYGARRWLNLGFMSYQPSETMKFATILALAKYFHARSTTQPLDFRDLIKPGLILGVPALLTIVQPDLGTGGHLAITGTAILLFVGIRTRVIVTALLAAVVSFPVAWQYGLKPYQQARIKTFLDPMADPKGEGYNALQSMIAVGSGQIAGKGFRQGTQTQLHYTPEGHTDFIFTVLAEEWGFFGALVLFGMYLFLLYRCVRTASLARDKFGSLVCVGIIGMLSSQIFINIAMVCGMFPIVGIPLPLVSYGGTSVITVCFALGILLNVGYRRTIF